MNFRIAKSMLGEYLDYFNNIEVFARVLAPSNNISAVNPTGIKKCFLLLNTPLKDDPGACNPPVSKRYPIIEVSHKVSLMSFPFFNDLTLELSSASGMTFS